MFPGLGFKFKCHFRFPFRYISHLQPALHVSHQYIGAYYSQCQTQLMMFQKVLYYMKLSVQKQIRLDQINLFIQINIYNKFLKCLLSSFQFMTSQFWNYKVSIYNKRDPLCFNPYGTQRFIKGQRSLKVNGKKSKLNQFELNLNVLGQRLIRAEMSHMDLIY